MSRSMNSHLFKRGRQLIAILSHPSSLLEPMDLPWNNVIHRSAKSIFRDPQVRILFKDLCDLLGIDSNYQNVGQKLYDYTIGGVSPYELVVLRHLAKHLAPQNIFEVGTFKGRTTMNLAEASGAKIYTLNWPQERCSFVVGENFKGTPFENRIVQLWGDTVNYDFQTLPMMDFVFIDADHSYEMVLQDSHKVFTRLNEGGVIMWHDVDPSHLGSARAVIEFCKAKNLPFRIIDGTALAIASKKLN